MRANPGLGRHLAAAMLLFAFGATNCSSDEGPSDAGLASEPTPTLVPRDVLPDEESGVPAIESIASDHASVSAGTLEVVVSTEHDGSQTACWDDPTLDYFVATATWTNALREYAVIWAVLPAGVARQTRVPLSSVDVAEGPASTLLPRPTTIHSNEWLEALFDAGFDEVVAAIGPHGEPLEFLTPTPTGSWRYVEVCGNSSIADLRAAAIVGGLATLDDDGVLHILHGGDHPFATERARAPVDVALDELQRIADEPRAG